ncbi:hypothetical protein [Puia dinghuensis]|uniref:DUF4340 domain-containing protein n=1 Tax=Puia dinghuensis TaxID=1792502 RepID=A0A8J2XT65_9BACT|nr:hypothetical protein [Puia dinghuensis]GGB00799.1 hypothetical protein GCM10011511_25110 [Puia dinghuensis]
MPLKLIKPTESAFFYNPRGKQLSLVSELKFYFNRNTHQFELDQNPHGEPKLTKINNLKLSADFSEMEFDAVYRNKDTQFKLLSEYPFDKTLYRTIAGIPDSDFAFRDDDKDKIELIFNQGAISQVYMYKHVDMNLVDSLTIIREDGVFYLIKQGPYAKIPLNSVVAADNRIISRSASEEFSYSVNDQEYIWNLLSRLINEKYDTSS